MNNIANLISYNKKNAIIVGSTNDKNVQFKNDTDIFETVIMNTSRDELIKKTHEMILTIVRNVQGNSNIYFMEFKAGIYRPLYISDEDIMNTRKRTAFYKEKLQDNEIDKDLFDTINTLHKQDLVYFCSNLYKVRWTIADILRDYVQLFNGKKFYFRDIFNIKSVIKIDIQYFNGQYFEPFSNMFEVLQHGKKLTDSPEDVIKSLNEDVKTLLREGNIYKAVKRAYSVASKHKNQELMDKLLLVINSEAGKLYQIKSGVESCEEILYKYKDKDTLNKVKRSLAYFSAQARQPKSIQNIFHKAQKALTVKTQLKVIVKLKHVIDNKVQILTKNLLEKYKISV